MDERKQLKLEIIKAIYKKRALSGEEHDAVAIGYAVASKYLKPVSIAKVMAALNKKGMRGLMIFCDTEGNIYHSDNVFGMGLCKWKFLNADGTECYDDDQSDETIKALLRLIE